MQRILPLKSVNPHLMCVLCGGYLTEATTIIECLHSFCKPCIFRFLETSYNCPVCDTEIHKTKPHQHIRSDPTLQEIVYKLVPGLYEAERKQKQAKLEKAKIERLSEPGPSSRVDVAVSDNENPDRTLVTLRYFKGPSKLTRADKLVKIFPTRYLCCPSNLPVQTLKKFVQRKFDLPVNWEVDIWRGDESLLDYLTLKDVIRIYGVYRERKPLEIHFSILPPQDDLKICANDDQNVNPVDFNSSSKLNTSECSSNDSTMSNSLPGKRLPPDDSEIVKNDEIKKRTLEDIANISPPPSAAFATQPVR